MPLGCHYKWAKVHWEVKIQMSPKKQGDLGKQDRLFFFFFFFLLPSCLPFNYFFLCLFSSLTLSCPTLCDPMDCSMPGFPVLHQLPELSQMHVHQVSDAIQPSHPLSSPSPPALNLSQHQGLFQLVHSSHQVAKVLEFQLQHQSFQ